MLPRATIYPNGSVRIWDANGFSVLRSGGDIAWRYNNPLLIKGGPGALVSDAMGTSVFADHSAGFLAGGTTLWPENKRDVSIQDNLDRFRQVSGCGLDVLNRFGDLIRRKLKLWGFPSQFPATEPELGGVTPGQLTPAQREELQEDIEDMIEHEEGTQGPQEPSGSGSGS